MDEKEIRIYQNSDHFFKSKKSQRVILMTTKGSDSYTNFKFDMDDTILFGRESAGVPKELHLLLKYNIKIPMNKKTRSLNVAMSVAIVTAEALRQNKLLK